MPTTTTNHWYSGSMYEARKNVTYPKKPFRMAAHTLHKAINTLIDSPPMNPAYKRLFTIALRSGLYRQVKGAFRKHALEARWNKPCMCATGVLCDLVKPAGEAWSKTNPNNTAVSSSDYFATAELSSNASGAIIELNDNGLSFKAIADLIDQYL